MDKITAQWVLCPKCRSKTRTKVRSDTILVNFPLFCPKCKRNFVVNVKDFKIEYLSEPDA